MGSIRRFTLKAAIAGMVIATSAAAARAGSVSLECAASAKHDVARLLGCVARCEERGGREEDVSCRYRCDARYETSIAARGCDSDAASAAAVHSAALHRQARAELVEARMLKCSARCRDSRSPETCVTRCEQRYLSENATETYKSLSGLGIDAPMFHEKHRNR